MRASSLLLALFCATIALTGTFAASKCGFNQYDFSSLMGQDILGTDGGTTYNYYLSVCGTLTSQPQCTQVESTSSTCQVQINPKGASYDTGNWVGSASWFYVDPATPSKGMGYTLTGAQSCWATGSPTDYMANVLFVCAPTQGQLTITVPPLSCFQNYTLPTPLACGPAPPQPQSDCKTTIDSIAYDLTPITKSDLVWQYSATETFALRVCGEVSTTACSGLPSTTSACLASSGSTFDMGDNFPVPGLPPLQYIDPNNPSGGVTYQIVGAKTCTEGGSATNFVSNVNLVCGASEGTLDVTAVSLCSYNWTVTTPVGCPPGHKFETNLPAIATE